MSSDDADGERSTRRRLDDYEVRARFAPAVGSVVPIVVLLVVGFGIDGEWVLAVFAASVTVVVAVLVASLSREAGVAVQARLWGPRGISPVVESLRWRDGPSRAETAARHAVVLQATGVELPDEETERADPDEADGRYRIAQDELRRHTSGGGHPGLRRALIQYGFVRNLRGLRPVCLVSAAVAVIGGIWVMVDDSERWFSGVAVIAVAVACTAIVGWLIDDDAVRSGGESYARALFDAASPS